jgi:hypothetical protein
MPALLLLLLASNADDAIKKYATCIYAHDTLRPHATAIILIDAYICAAAADAHASTYVRYGGPPSGHIFVPLGGAAPRAMPSA